MLIINPGTRHFNPANGAAILDASDFATPATSVASLNNNPAAQ
jgi:hypothetical protein